MKLNEITAKSKLTTEEKEHRSWYIEGATDFPKKCVKLTPEGNFVVDLTQASAKSFGINLFLKYKHDEKIRYKFEKITLGGKTLSFSGKVKNLVGLPSGALDGSLQIKGSRIESLVGCPTEIQGVFTFWDDYGSSELKSWEHAPHTVHELRIKAPSLIGIHHHITQVTGGIVTVDSQQNRISADPRHIGFYKEGGIGLILIPGVKEIRGTFSNTTKISDGPFAIIQKYAGRPGDIFECQTELIDAGYEEFAEL